MSVTISSWAQVDGDCAMRYLICQDETIEIHFGGQFDGFDFDLAPAAARRLAAMMHDAVRSYDEKRATPETNEEDISRPER